jgi:chorismate mutase
MPVRGIRGATSVSSDHTETILRETRALLLAAIDANPTLVPEDIASVIFTTTADLVSVFPARAARELGWRDVPLMCAHEIPVPGSLQRIVRILIHWNTDILQSAVRHVYLGEAAQLRPDLAENN